MYGIPFHINIIAGKYVLVVVSEGPGGYLLRVSGDEDDIKISEFGDQKGEEGSK